MSYWKRVRKIARSQTPQEIQKSRLILKFAKLGFLGVVAATLLFFIALPIIAYQLPTPDKIVRREGFSTKILDRNGKPLYDIFNNQNRNPVEVKDIPENLKHATIAIEDKDFYKHQGFDIKGILRGFSRLFTRGRAQGGSTLTQQLVKNVLLTDERSITRKIKEFILAVQIERKYSKDQILQMYLNEAPYGGTAWGVGTASEIYFGKEVKDLNLVESAIIAGLPQRPSYYSPYTGQSKAYVDRTKAVLRRMREDGYIKSDEEKQALSDLENIQFSGKSSEFKAPHFVQYVQKKLEDRYGESVLEQGGLKVTTTIDLDLQEKAQEIVADEISKVEKFHITNGAAVVLDSQTGEILAMVGSKNFNDPNYDGQYNVATALRQPGSSIKPFTYVTALKQGYTPATLLMDVPTEFPGGAGQPSYKPVNYDGKFRGPIQVRYALANSINIPAVKMLAIVGMKDMMETAYEMGIKSLEPTKENMSKFGLSITLGGGEVRLLELTDAYASFMNEGYDVEPQSILKVEDSKGKVLEDIKPKKGKRVLSAEHAYLISDILSDNDARKDVFGLNSLLNIPGRSVAVKTGTTNERKDNWTVGGTPQLVTGVWVGNNDNTSMTQVASGVTGASPIWRRILLEALKGKPIVGFTKPDGIHEKEIDKVSGYSSHDGFPTRLEKFVAGTEPGEDIVHVKLKVCKSDGKLATPADIAAGNYDEKEFFKFTEKDPLMDLKDGNKWQEGINAWIASQNNPMYNPPTDFCGTSNPVNVEFINPREHDSNLGNNISVEVKAYSTSDIKELRLEADGVNVRSFSSPPYKEDITLPDGVHELRAVAKDRDGHESERRITIGVHTAWDSNKATATPTPTSIISI